MIKLLPFILFQKYIYILALEKANPGNCANCIGTFRSVYSRTKIYAARVSYAAERADGRAAVLSKLLDCSCRCRSTAEAPAAVDRYLLPAPGLRQTMQLKVASSSLY